MVANNQQSKEGEGLLENFDSRSTNEYDNNYERMTVIDQATELSDVKTETHDPDKQVHSPFNLLSINSNEEPI